MITRSDNTLRELPFYNLNQDFIRATGAWAHFFPNTLYNSKDLLHDIIDRRIMSSRYHGSETSGSQQYGASATTTTIGCVASVSSRGS